MTDFTFKVEPDSEKSVALQAAVNGTFGAPIESFRYDASTGIILVTTRAIPAFGILDKESAESKLVQRLIKDYRAQDAVLLTRVKDADGREAAILLAERKLVANTKANADKIVADNLAAEADRTAKKIMADALIRQREQELDRIDGDLRQRENELAKEREAFEREKAGLPPLTLREKARFVLRR